MLYIPLPSDVSHPSPGPAAWPSRFRSVHAALIALDGPASAAQVAATLASAPSERVAELLETLVTLGRARQTVERRFMGCFPLARRSQP